MKIFFLVMLGIGVYIGGLIITAFIFKRMGVDKDDTEAIGFLIIWPLTLVVALPIFLIIGLIRFVQTIVWGKDE